MIGYLKGVVLYKEENGIIVLCGGVGYEVFLPSSLRNRVEEGEEISLWIDHRLFEDRLELFGFSSRIEREIFRLLKKVQRVGVKTALSLLGYFSPQELMVHLCSSDIEALMKVSGVGKKTAQRIILELKDQMNRIGFSSEPGEDLLIKDATRALMVLGYSQRSARERVRNALLKVSPKTLENILKYALLE